MLGFKLNHVGKRGYTTTITEADHRTDYPLEFQRHQLHTLGYFLWNVLYCNGPTLYLLSKYQCWNVGGIPRTQTFVTMANIDNVCWKISVYFYNSMRLDTFHVNLLSCITIVGFARETLYCVQLILYEFVTVDYCMVKYNTVMQNWNCYTGTKLCTPSKYLC